jgi:hypothetical protein
VVRDIDPDLVHNGDGPGAYLRLAGSGTEHFVPFAIFCPEQPFSHLGAGSVCRADKENPRFIHHFPSQQEDFSSFAPQQEPSSPPQLHSVSMSFPRSAALIIAHAQPTPLCTSMAWT